MNKAKWIDNLFARFAIYYGHVWRSQFKEKGFLDFAKSEWQAGLSDFSQTVLDKAILQCRDFYEMPPTLPQLIACCRQIRKNLNFYVVRDDTPRAKKTVVALHIQRCKDLLIPTIKREPLC